MRDRDAETDDPTPGTSSPSLPRWRPWPFLVGVVASSVLASLALTWRSNTSYAVAVALGLVVTMVVVCVRWPSRGPLAFAFGWLTWPVACVAGFGLYSTLAFGPLGRGPFDPEAWRAHRAHSVFQRSRAAMVGHLRSSGLLETLDRRRVVELLGTPSQDNHKYLLWHVQDTFPVDSEWLWVFFGADGRVESHFLWYD